MLAITTATEFKSNMVLLIFGATLFAVYQLYVTIMGWLGFAKQTVKVAKWLHVTTGEVRGQFRRMTRERRRAAIGLTTLLFLVEIAWLAMIRETGNLVVRYFYEPGPRPPGAIGPSPGTWHLIADAYLMFAVVLLVILTIRAHEGMDTHDLSWILAIPSVAWGWPGAYHLTLCVLFSIFGLPNWHDVRIDAAALLSCLLLYWCTRAALNSAKQVGLIWRNESGRP